VVLFHTFPITLYSGCYHVGALGRVLAYCMDALRLLLHIHFSGAKRFLSCLGFFTWRTVVCSCVITNMCIQLPPCVYWRVFIQVFLKAAHLGIHEVQDTTAGDQCYGGDHEQGHFVYFTCWLMFCQPLDEWRAVANFPNNLLPSCHPRDHLPSKL
jgi:hypothetical protein